MYMDIAIKDIGLITMADCVDIARHGITLY